LPQPAATSQRLGTCVAAETTASVHCACSSRRPRIAAVIGGGTRSPLARHCHHSKQSSRVRLRSVSLPSSECLVDAPAGRSPVPLPHNERRGLLSASACGGWSSEGTNVAFALSADGWLSLCTVHVWWSLSLCTHECAALAHAEKKRSPPLRRACGCKCNDRRELRACFWRPLARSRWTRITESHALAVSM